MAEGWGGSFVQARRNRNRRAGPNLRAGRFRRWGLHDRALQADRDFCRRWCQGSLKRLRSPDPYVGVRSRRGGQPSRDSRSLNRLLGPFDGVGLCNPYARLQSPAPLLCGARHTIWLSYNSMQETICRKKSELALPDTAIWAVAWKPLSARIQT